MALPIYQSDSTTLSMLQTNWAKELNPVLAFPLNSGLILSQVALTTGANVVNHKLARKLQGWFIVRQRSAGTAYDTQDSNQTPALTLNLTSSANMTVDLVVF